MSRTSRFLASLLLLVTFIALPPLTGRTAAIAACVATPIAAQATPIATFPVTVTDDAGRAVTLESMPRRIVSLAPSNTEVLFALGLEERIVAVDTYSDYPPAVADVPKVGDYADPDLEQIVALDPDLVVGTALHATAIVPRLDELGIPAVVLEPTSLDGILANIETVGRLAGIEADATALVCALHSRVDTVERAVAGAPRPRVFFELSPDLYSTGEGTFIADLLARAGGENIVAGSLGPWPQLSAEAVVGANPEVILLADHEAGVTPETVAARPGWGGIAAVANGRVVALETNIVVRPGPRVVDGLEAIARALHPERFADESG